MNEFERMLKNKLTNENDGIVNEFVQMLKDKGIVKELVEKHKHSLEHTRAKNGNPDWMPDMWVLELTAKIGLEFELMSDEKEVAEAFAELAHALAMKAVSVEIAKIMMEEK